MNIELVEQIVALMGEHPVSEISVEQEGFKVRVCRPLSVASPVETAAVSVVEFIAEPEIVLPETHTLTASMVGIFHHGTPPLPYAALVTVGQVVGSIESMKLMNEVSAEYGGRVIETLTEDGAAVEYGQPQFRLAAVE
jgi:acetyl-CoA carboxylase biotin carboxyl carrier protein